MKLKKKEASQYETEIQETLRRRDSIQDSDYEEDDDVLESDDDGSSGESFCSVCRVVESSSMDNVSIL